MSEQGRKYDGGKLRYDLLPVMALEDVVKGLTYGTIKYDDNNWVKVPEGRKRYIAAAMRHVEKYRVGVLFDEESGVHHLSAAIDNLMFIVEKDLRGWEDIPEETKDISQEELEEYITTLPEQKPIQCEHCTHGWLPWPLSAKREGSPCHMCKNGEARKTVADEFYVLGNKEIARIIPESEYGKIRKESLWYPPVEDGGNPWVEHTSSVRPIGEDIRVEVLFRHHRQNEIFSSEKFTAWKLDWEKYDGDFCIIAYRIVD